MFANSKWIWKQGGAQADEHAEFFTHFSCTQADLKKGVRLYISADTDFCVYVNGALVDFGQYPDYPHYKTYEVICLTPFVQKQDKTSISGILDGWVCGMRKSARKKK